MSTGDCKLTSTGFRRFGGRLAQDVWDVLRAASPRHSDLRSRLVKALVLTLIVDVVASVAMFFLERNAPSTEIQHFGDALYWTTTQLTTLSSPLPNPLTGAGKIIAVAVDLYTITVASTLAGMFAAFFHRHVEEGGSRHADTSR